MFEYHKCGILVILCLVFKAKAFCRTVIDYLGSMNASSRSTSHSTHTCGDVKGQDVVKKCSRIPDNVYIKVWSWTSSPSAYQYR